MEDPVTAGARSLSCPFCEEYELLPLGPMATRCESCGSLISGALLKTLRQITALPESIGSHPCECGHPQMRRLPDGVYRCPACGSEVLPIGYP